MKFSMNIEKVIVGRIYLFQKISWVLGIQYGNKWTIFLSSHFFVGCWSSRWIQYTQGVYVYKKQVYIQYVGEWCNWQPSVDVCVWICQKCWWTWSKLFNFICFCNLLCLKITLCCLWNYNVFHFYLYVGHARKIRVSFVIYKFGKFDLIIADLPKGLLVSNMTSPPNLILS